ncbi:MAG TPA: DUF1835 domain-containing protein [Bacillus sp. (in: firmicutes)]|nr:DUF1835 domain-containing protein [Bacillus sp. (in: firmicutes)]
MTKNLRNSIMRLSEKEAKSILLQTMARLKMIHDSSNKSSKEKIDELYAMCNELLEFSQKKEEFVQDYKTVHLVCGEAQAGTLKVGLGRGNKVIGFPDFFTVGPMWELHTIAGQKHRYEWLREHLNYGDDFTEERYKRKLSETHTEIELYLII